MTVLQWRDTPGSSNVVRFGFDSAEPDSLIVQYKGENSYYVYLNVGEKPKHGLVYGFTHFGVNFSVGRFLAAEIKPFHQFRKLTAEEIASVKAVPMIRLTRDANPSIDRTHSETLDCPLSQFLSNNSDSEDICEIALALKPGERHTFQDIGDWDHIELLVPVGATRALPADHKPQATSGGQVF